MGEKKVKGRKRQIGVDTQGHLLHIEVHRANEHDTNVGVYVLDELKEKYDSIQAFCADAGYRGNTQQYSEILLDTPVHISPTIKNGFEVIPKRWVVERTLAWLGHSRRLSKDYEINTRHSENMVRVAMLRLTLTQFCRYP